jgi:hypothetical protein
MVTVREPVLKPVTIADLRPTQITVGMREVAERRERWRALKKNNAEFLGRHMIPVVLGPKDRHYIIDHHHLARALHDEGVEWVFVTIMMDLKLLELDAFWVVLDNRGWMYPFDAKGRRCAYTDIPKSVGGLTDDPFRSLAGKLRREGMYAKETTPFSEFLWADFLRRQMKRKLLDRDYERAVAKARRLAKSQAARYLPGWCGPARDD